MQNPKFEDRSRDAALNRYLDALDSGDLDALDEVLAQAETDAELDRQIQNVNRTVYADAGLVPLAERARTVRRLLATHMPTAVFSQAADHSETQETVPLTVADVASRIEINRAAGAAGTSGMLITTTDLEANRALRANPLQLPQVITATSVRDLLARLGVGVSERYGRLFRETALALGMGRQQSVALAAARRAGRRRNRSALNDGSPTAPAPGSLDAAKSPPGSGSPPEGTPRGE